MDKKRNDLRSVGKDALDRMTVFRLRPVGVRRQLDKDLPAWSKVPQLWEQCPSQEGMAECWVCISCLREKITWSKRKVDQLYHEELLVLQSQFGMWDDLK